MEQIFQCRASYKYYKEKFRRHISAIMPSIDIENRDSLITDIKILDSWFYHNNLFLTDDFVFAKRSDVNELTVVSPSVINTFLDEYNKFYITILVKTYKVDGDGKSRPSYKHLSVKEFVETFNTHFITKYGDLFKTILINGNYKEGINGKLTIDNLMFDYYCLSIVNNIKNKNILNELERAKSLRYYIMQVNSILKKPDNDSLVFDIDIERVFYCKRDKMIKFSVRNLLTGEEFSQPIDLLVKKINKLIK